MSWLKRSGSAPDFEAIRSDLNQAKIGSPWLTLFLDDGGCVFYNPKEGDLINVPIDISGSRFLASWGQWFLMLDVCESKLYIIDVISGKRKDLPPLEKIASSTYPLKRVGVGEFELELPHGNVFELFADEIRGRLWVDEKTEEWSLVWFFDAPASFLCSLKKGNDVYSFIPVRLETPKLLSGLYGLVLRGYRLYILTTRFFVREIDLSGAQGFEEVTGDNPARMFSYPGINRQFTIAVTTKEEVLLVTTTTFERSERSFCVYKKDPNSYKSKPDRVKVDSLGNEALLLDLGITVPANQKLGIKPNCIYFTRHECIGRGPSSDFCHDLPPYQVDICVFNLTTNSLESFSPPLKLKDARWFFTMT